MGNPCDINKGAIQTTVKRLEGIITEQIESITISTKQKDLIADDNEKSPPPAQLYFAVHRVNDYDLAIQHNEAVNLAWEPIGITRTRSDSFFDGSIGQRLAKTIPFGHPLSVLDLEDLKKELSARPNEEREVEARIRARLKASSFSFCRPASAEPARARGSS